MIQTELRFVGVLKEIDELQEELFDLGGEQNSICDNCHPEFQTCYVGESNEYTPEAKARDAEIEKEADAIDAKLDAIRLQMDLNEDQFDIMRDSCIVNRWEIYAQMMGAEIISIKDMFSGKI